MKIGICDDNPIFLNYIYELIQKHFSITAGVIVETLNPDQLSRMIADRVIPYDVIVTDIDMGNFNGIQLAKEMNEVSPSCAIIFVSNYLNYATEVYDAQHIYFVLKTELDVRLPKALDKAVAVYKDRKNNFIMIRYQNIDNLIPLADITHIEALGRYLYIYDGKLSYKYINTLKGLASELSASFLRCHKSYIVNVKHIRSISRTNCILTNGANIPISQTYWKSFQAAYINHISKSL